MADELASDSEAQAEWETKEVSGKCSLHILDCDPVNVTHKQEDNRATFKAMPSVRLEGNYLAILIEFCIHDHCLSPLYSRLTIHLHIMITAYLHQSFLWLQPTLRHLLVDDSPVRLPICVCHLADILGCTMRSGAVLFWAARGICRFLVESWLQSQTAFRSLSFQAVKLSEAVATAVSAFLRLSTGKMIFRLSYLHITWISSLPPRVHRRYHFGAGSGQVHRFGRHIWDWQLGGNGVGVQIY